MHAWVGLLSLFLFFASAAGDAIEAKLRKKLFDGYDPKARPVLKSTSPIVVNVRCSLVQVIQVDVLGQKIQASLWLKLGWIDEMLKWNMTEFPIETISTPVADVWKPDFAIYNALKKLEHTNVEENLLIFNNGHVLVVYSIIAEVPCGMDVRMFPFDRQSCKIKMGSWTYHSGLLSLNRSSLSITIEQYTQSSEWDLIKHEGTWHRNKYECCDKWEFEDITYELVLQRKPTYYVWNLVVPCITLLCIGIVAHLLEPNGERLNVSITTLLAFIVFLLMVPDMLPPQADSVSRIALLFGLSIVLLGCSTVATVVTIHLTEKSTTGAPLRPWHRFLFNIFSKCELCLCHKDMLRMRQLSRKDRREEEKEDNNGRVTELESESTGRDQRYRRELEWLAFAAGFDRVCWILFVLGCITNLLVFFL